MLKEKHRKFTTTKNNHNNNTNNNNNNNDKINILTTNSLTFTIHNDISNINIKDWIYYEKKT